MTTNNKKGKLIVFEGIDHSFKQTNSDSLTVILSEMNKPTIKLEFPYYEKGIGKEIYRILHKESKDELYKLPELFHKEQIEFIPLILEYLNQGINVIIDRFFLSNLAYNDDYTLSKVDEFDELCIDYLIYMDMDPDIIKDKLKERASKNNETVDNIESDISRLKKARRNYLYYLAIDDNLFNKTIIVKTFNDDGTLRTEKELENNMMSIAKLITGRDDDVDIF